MLNRIQEERLNPLNWSFLGRDSIFNDGSDSCMTWSREHLKSLNIDLGNSLLGWVITPTSCYTNSSNYYRKYPISIQL
ncbi:hypothetical protein PNK_2016 [Candidatus Protochlamydia naegleriophila]|uniref:Uncharacterized protein n=1 Tax=Candidatus Protochlamydia naegleriophila TaxID=389348 RepID=A0A0U5JFN5_9BACT|nr:hypothetical protein PNK_2016 [Candidatus Protochlamydia naegleriophila]